ncbi:MAG: porin, partial [Pseudomonadota bacterium]
MRKFLLGTTALVSAAVVASSAYADGHGSVKLTAFQRIYLESIDEDFTNTATVDRDQDYYFVTGGSNSELHWTFTKESDDGMTYGARFDTRWGGNSTDEVYLFFRGNWGTIHLGNDDDVTTNMVPGGENVLTGRFGYDGAHNNNVSAREVAEGVNLLALNAPDPIGGDGDNTKVAYYSPKSGGFQLGVSFEPGNDTTIASASSARSNNYNSIFALAATYEGSAGGLSYSFGGGYIGADNDSNNHEDLEFYQIGGTLSSGGITLALGYGDNGDSGLTKTDTVGATAATTDGDAGDYYNIGLSYNYGAGSIA